MDFLRRNPCIRARECDSVDFRGRIPDREHLLNSDEGAMDRRILVVDDSELIGQQLTQLLASPRRQISVARDGTTALEWLVERPYSLVITDLRLPGISGLDLIREIRNR